MRRRRDKLIHEQGAQMTLTAIMQVIYSTADILQKAAATQDVMSPLRKRALA